MEIDFFEQEMVEMTLSFFDLIIGPRVITGLPWYNEGRSNQFISEYFDFHIIIFHLKAGSDEDSRLRREAAIVMLKDYLDTNVPISGDPDWIVLGDWNDELDDPVSENVFTPFLDDSANYTFLNL